MKIESTHNESWYVDIRREDGDEGWPDTARDSYWSKSTPDILPDRLYFTLERGRKHFSGGIAGHSILKENRQGGRKHIATYGKWPEWSQALIRKAREFADMTPERTGVPW